VGSYRLLGESVDDAAGEAFDKTAKLLGLGYPGGPALARLAESGRAGAVTLPRPMHDSGDLDMSFSGLKTAVLTLIRRDQAAGRLDRARSADIARGFQDAVADVLVGKCVAALAATGHAQLVVAGGVGANLELRARLRASVRRRGGEVYFPEPEWCTDNGAMIAHVGALRLGATKVGDYAFSVRPRWDLATLAAPAAALPQVRSANAPKAPRASASASDRPFPAFEQLPDVGLVAPDE
jgi:N6-L-threonylcarbamoyladenine synthase